MAASKSTLDRGYRAETVSPWASYAGDKENNARPSPRESLLTRTKTRHIGSREVLFYEGQPADTVYAVRRGLIKLASHRVTGRARIVRLHGQGDWIGLGGLLDQPYEHTAIAVGEVEICPIAARKLRALRYDDPQVYCNLMETWYFHLRSADIWISEFSTGPIKARVARLLCFLAKLEFGPASTIVELLTCDEMASVLGVTAESVSRILAAFKRDAILLPVGRNGTELYCMDAAVLTDLSR